MGSLDAYERGIRDLCDRFPLSWGIISMVDSLCHTEQWNRLFDEYEEMKSPPWDPARPWDTIIYNSSYGISGALAHWWNTRVEHPAGLQPAAARAFLAKTEGLPAAAAASSAHDYGKIKDKGKGK